MIRGQFLFYSSRKGILMLVLGRKKEQAILIGDNIRIVITAVRGDNVRIGIEAPKDVVVMREELVKNDK
jgi:carbon storage regulator